jgi:hypothetical protein
MEYVEDLSLDRFNEYVAFLDIRREEKEKAIKKANKPKPRAR